LASHLNRLNRHVARYAGAQARDLKHVFLCGETAAVEDAARQFQKNSRLDVRIVRPADVKATWRLVDGAADAATALTLGGLLMTYLAPEECDAPNLMQRFLAGQQEPLRPRLLASAFPVAATLLAALAFSWVNVHGRAALHDVQNKLDGVAVAAARATELRLQLTAAEAKLAQLRLLASKLPGALGSEAVRTFGGCMPDDVWLTNLAITDGTNATVQGASYLEAGVYDFVHFLEMAPGFVDVALRRTSATSVATGPATSFELAVTLGDFDDQATRMARHD
jgi:hypothetical protein